jgi:hypothetical protein
LLYWWVRVPRVKKPVAKTEWALFVIVVLFSYIFIGSTSSSVAISSVELNILIFRPILQKTTCAGQMGIQRIRFAAILFLRLLLYYRILVAVKIKGYPVLAWPLPSPLWTFCLYRLLILKWVSTYLILLFSIPLFFFYIYASLLLSRHVQTF